MYGVNISDKGYVVMGMPPEWQVKSISDYNGDGKSDVHLQDADTGKIYVRFMDGIVINSGGYADQGVPGNRSIY
ncbi:hypothetical protein MBAV_000681 [Candidatus Magnetobacterium bavaricum]|uniref:FG-GAP repeat-containing protein n=1 Tax=Candidatus Magnetobacterium bavaricum TaxID=29290 RepID=A0A0F3GYS2_9BACT|nr:hypothetical protein MBAV_000681 [Candidatus Magnetobacterium bavaricum]